jgi:putative ABC transport system permease protein
MSLFTRFVGALGGLLQKKRLEQELDEELREYLEAAIERNMAAGMNRDDAVRAAHVELGSLESVKDHVREAGWESVIESVLKDVSHAVRLMHRNPGLTAVAVLSLALGIGANTAIFQLINAVRLRTLPVPDPQELVSIRTAGGNQGLGISSGFTSDLTFGLWRQIREHQEAFSGVFAWSSSGFQLGSGADAQFVDGLWVSGDLFPVLKVAPARGRLFTEADDQRGCGASSAVISYAFWQSHFGGDDSAVGKTLTIMDRPVQIIGVSPKGFFGLEVGKGFDVALPICAEAVWGDAAEHLNRWWLAVMGRLKPDWSLVRASEHLNALSPALFEATLPPGYNSWVDERYRKLRLTATPAANGSSRLRENYNKPLWLLLAMTGMVLLVACVNLANLMLARATAREREIAVRIAIGASRRRVVFQLLAESMALALLGGAFGILLSDVLSHGLVSFLNTQAEPILIDIRPDWHVLAFTAAVSIFTCIAFGLVPAFRSSRVQPAAAMKTGGRTVTANRERFSIQRLLVISQIAISLVLLAGAFLFVRSFRNLTTLDAGFREKGIVFMFVNYASHVLPPDQRPPYQTQLLEQIRSVPGVSSAALLTNTPLTGSSWTLGIHVPNGQGEEVGDSKFTYVSPRYFETLGVPLIAGRDFNEFDRAGSRRVAIVNETFVQRYLKTTNPIGAQLRTVAEPDIPATQYEIIGVAKDTKYSDLRERIPATTFVPILQNPSPSSFAGIAIHSSQEPDRLTSALRQRFKELHPDLPVAFMVFEKQIQDGLSRDRMMAWLAGFFGFLAAILAMTGLYGLISYILQCRVHEIGIRMALGATRPSVIALVFRQTAVLVIVGLIVGVPAWLITARSATALLFGVLPSDAPTLIAAAGFLAVIAACASFVPAYRASRIDPMEALRDE